MNTFRTLGFFCNCESFFAVATRLGFCEESFDFIIIIHHSKFSSSLVNFSLFFLLSIVSEIKPSNPQFLQLKEKNQSIKRINIGKVAGEKW